MEPVMMPVISDYKSPLAVTTDELGTSKVQVAVVILGLKKKKMKNKPANGNVDVQFGSRNLQAIVELVKKEGGVVKSNEYYKYKVNKLPGDILPDKCTYKVENDKVVIILEKADSSSWAGDLCSNGLETQPDDDVGDDVKDK